MIKIIPKEIIMFIKNRLREFKVSKAIYEDELNKADKGYLKHLETQLN